MAELSYPTAGGGSVTESRYEQLIGSAVPSGLIGTPALLPLVYADATGQQVKARASRAAIVRGFRWETDGAGLTRTIAAASSQPRWDLAVLRLNRSDWTVTFQVLTGAPAATPVVPTPTQSTGTTGVWELPLARIYVPNGTSGVPGSNVYPMAWYIGQQPILATRDTMPAITPGVKVFEWDTGIERTGVGADKIVITAEDDPIVSLTANPVWNSQALNVARRNGFVYFTCTISRASAGATTANAATQIIALPAKYRPPQDVGIIGINHTSRTPIRAYLSASTGSLDVTVHSGINIADFITLGPCIWPSNVNPN